MQDDGILSIQSAVAYGHVGNSAAVFPLQRLGFEVWPVNTVLFSNHTGYGAWRGRVVELGWIEELILGLRERDKDGSWRSRGVYWCRNVGTKQAAKFGPSQLLVADNDRVETTGICVADWNGDGRPDLIASRLEYKTADTHRWQQNVWVYLRRGG